MKRFLFIILSLNFFIARSQNFNTIVSDLNYISTLASGASLEVVDDIAIKNLSTKIARYSMMDENMMGTYLEDICDASEFQYKNKKSEIQVIRYIKKDNIGVIFDGRKTKIKEMLSLAETALDKYRIDVALRNLYWAETLIQSLPEFNDFIYVTSYGENFPAIEWTRSSIENILNGITSSFSKQGKEITQITFQYNGHPVQSIDYCYFDGNTWSDVCHASNGTGIIPSGNDISTFKIKYEAIASDMLHINRKVDDVRKALGTTKVANTIKVPLAVTPKIDVSKEVKQKILDVVSYKDRQDKQQTAKIEDYQIKPLEEAGRYELIIDTICKSIEAHNYSSVENLFNDDGYDTFTKLIQYGNAKLLEKPDLFFYKLGGQIFCRSLPMAFSFQNNTRTFIEDVIFTFNEDDKISNITFSLGKQAVNDITSHEDWSEEARIILINFLENYKTAYSLKRLDYISSIFDEDALIITGNVLRRTSSSTEFSSNPVVTYSKYTKEQYIKRLAASFKSKDFINIQFADDKVIRMGKNPNLYGIQIRQDYFSSNYSDSGYLFILVDMENPSSPLIHIRTWQETPDKDFGIIGPYHF